MENYSDEELRKMFISDILEIRKRKEEYRQTCLVGKLYLIFKSYFKELKTNWYSYYFDYHEYKIQKAAGALQRSVR